MISSYVKKRRVVNALTAGMIVAAGLFMIGYGAKVAVDDLNYEIPKSGIMNVLAKSCENSIREAQLYPRKVDGGFKITSHDISDPYMKIAKWSMAIQQCFGYELKSFCVGDGCTKEHGAPLHFELGEVGE